jgi:hypothetical protein
MLDKRLNDKGKNWRHVFKVSPSSRLQARVGRPRIPDGWVHSEVKDLEWIRVAVHTAQWGASRNVTSSY